MMWPDSRDLGAAAMRCTPNLPATYAEVMAPLDLRRLPFGLRSIAAADPLVERFIILSDAVRRQERVSSWTQWTPAQAEAWAAPDWVLFSRLRGYTETQIEEFALYLSLSTEVDAKHGQDFASEVDFWVQQACTTPELEAVERTLCDMSRAALASLSDMGTSDAL